MTLLDAELEKEYIISRINTDDSELDSFLLSLGCFEGGKIAVILRKRSFLVISIKDGRYSIDTSLANAIELKD